MGHLLTLLQKKKAIVSDSFNRADNALTMGNADTGQAWSTLGVCTWAILNNKAIQTNTVTTTTALATIDALISNFVVSVKVTFQTNEGIAFRIQDSINYLTIRLSASGLGLFKIIDGTATQLGSYVITPTTGTVYTLRIQATGSSIIVSINGLQVISTTDTMYQSLTKVGLREATPSVGNGAFDDFLVEGL